MAQDATKARASAQKLEPAILRGDLMPLLEKMHPRWKERLSKRAGGDAALAASFKNQAKQIAEAGVKIDAFTVSPATDKPVPVNFGREMLVFLPTLKIISGLDNKGVLRQIEQKGFLIAVTDVGKDDWTFIDGSTLSKSDIRSLFPELKKDFVTPPFGSKEIK
mgnify:CR=1 FL=1